MVASPDNRYSKAGLYAIFATQSNDFALGYPIGKRNKTLLFALHSGLAVEKVLSCQGITQSINRFDMSYKVLSRLPRNHIPNNLSASAAVAGNPSFNYP